MINIEQIDINSMNIGELIEFAKNNGVYIIAWSEEAHKWYMCSFDLLELSNLVSANQVFAVVKIYNYTEEELKNIPASAAGNLFGNSVLTNLESEPLKKSHTKFTTDKEPEIANKACYAFLASNSTGSISLLPKSNGALRINFNTKEQAEAYLKQFRRKMHYVTNSVDMFTVANFYSMLGLVLTSEQQDIVCKYGWSTVDNLSKLDNWLSPQVTKTSDETGWYGFTISKRATRIYDKDTDTAFHR